MNTFIIGIVSCLPDNEKRAARFAYLDRLMNAIKDYPKIIIAQGWEKERTYDNATIYRSEPLGIPLARRTLWEKFVEQNEHTHLLMLDDDAEIVSVNANFEYSDFATEFNNLLDNCLISKIVAAACPFPLFEDEYFEDQLYTRMLEARYAKGNSLPFHIKRTMGGDTSTWYTPEKRAEMAKNTLAHIMTDEVTAAWYEEQKKKAYERSIKRTNAVKLIAQKKALLVKYREDVEQVELFGMERADYAEKKAACKTLVEELRVLEKQLL